MAAKNIEEKKKAWGCDGCGGGGGGGEGGLQIFQTACLPDSEMEEKTRNTTKKHTKITPKIDSELCSCHAIDIQSKSTAMHRSPQLENDGQHQRCSLTAVAMHLTPSTKTRILYTSAWLDRDMRMNTTHRELIVRWLAYSERQTT